MRVLIFVIQQICWTQGHVDLTVYNIVLLDEWLLDECQHFFENN